jgi:glucose/mannose-6-phosphate isomerase
MREIILNSPKQFRLGSGAAKNVKVRGKFKNVLICGMGGSALPGDVLKMWLQNSGIKLPLFIHRNYSLPYQVDRNHLIACISYSGNTEEPLSSFKEAKKRGLKIVGIGSGGELETLCQKYKIPFAKVPSGCLPRMALDYQFSALFQILINCGLIKNSLKDVLALEKKLKPRSLEVQGKKLAKKLKDKIPIIYASDKNKTLARIWKIKFNEGPKIPAFCNYFPELNHNEMSAFENPLKELHVILLKDPSDHPGILKRMNLTAKIIKSKNVSLDFVPLKDANALFKIFENLLLSDWVSYYLAKEYGVDPLSLKLQEKFKLWLKSKKQ